MKILGVGSHKIQMGILDINKVMLNFEKNMNKVNIAGIEKSEERLKSSLVNANDSYEICINCKSQTNILRSTNIDHRYGYVVGLGQLCISCYKKNPF